MPAALSPYSKSIAALIAAAAAALTQWVSTGTFDAAELATAITGIITAALVYRVPNTGVERPATGVPSATLEEVALPGEPFDAKAADPTMPTRPVD